MADAAAQQQRQQQQQQQQQPSESVPPRHVLLTGASGFLGSHLTAALRSRSYVVHTLSRSPPPPPPLTPSQAPPAAGAQQSESATTHYACDLTAPDAPVLLDRVLAERDDWHAVIHLAGLVSYTARDAARMQALNVDATEALLSALAKHCSSSTSATNATRFVFCSSVAAVGSNATAAQPPLNEASAWDDNLARVAYVHTKRAAEVLVRDAPRALGLRTVSFCPSNVFGAGDAKKASRKTQVRAANGKGRIYTNGGVSIVHVDVVVKAFLAALDAPADDPIFDGSRWLLTGDNVSIREMLRLFAVAGGHPAQAPWIRLPDWLLRAICWVAERLGSKSLAMDRFTVATRFHWFDGSAARERFNLPDVPAHQAIADSVAWMRQNGMLNSSS